MLAKVLILAAKPSL